MNFFLDFLFPKKCVNCGRFGSYICKVCFSKVEFVQNPVCPVCGRQAIGGKTHPGCRGRYKLDGLIAGIRYRGLVRKGIGKIKYRWVWDIAETFVDLMVEPLWRFDMPVDFVLVPIPLHKKRKNWRGFNQAELICQILAKRFKVGWQDALVRVRETKTQVGLSKDARRENIKDAFNLNGNRDIKGKNLILVDDVFTTGATMAEACKVLKKAGAGGVWAMVLALD